MINKKHVEEAIDAITSMCEWKETPQGGKYWCEVIYNLDELKEACKE